MHHDQPLKYNEFIEKKYNELTSYLRDAYESLDKYTDNYIKSYGFSEWLETMRGKELDFEHTKDIAVVFTEHANRNTNEIVSVLAGISHQYNVEYPVIEGLMTKEFWEREFDGRGNDLTEPKVTGRRLRM